MVVCVWERWNAIVWLPMAVQTSYAIASSAIQINIEFISANVVGWRHKLTWKRWRTSAALLRATISPQLFAKSRSLMLASCSYKKWCQCALALEFIQTQDRPEIIPIKIDCCAGERTELNSIYHYKTKVFGSMDRSKLDLREEYRFRIPSNVRNISSQSSRYT